MTTTGTVSGRVTWSYASFAFPLAMLGYPLGIWLPRAYATDMGVALQWIGIAGMVASIVDAITDPPMGFVSDRFRMRWGRRRPWIVVGVPWLTLSVWMLLNPTPGISPWYLVGWYVALRLGGTLLGTPFAAWGAELSTEYHARTRIQSAREMVGLLGLVAAALVPAGVETVYGSAATAARVLAAYSGFIVVLLPLALLALVTQVPELPKQDGEGRTSWLRSLSLMKRNRLFFVIIGIEFLITGGESFRNAMSLFFMQEVIRVPRAGWLYVMYFAAGLGAIPAWNALARAFGKHRSLAAAMLLVSIDSLIIFALRPLFDARLGWLDDRGVLYAFYALFAVKGFCFGAFAYLPRAMVADVVDVDTARSRDSRPASYFAILGFMTKLATSFGFLSLPALGLVGFDPRAGAAHSANELAWLGVLYAIVPTALFVAALYLAWTWPLTPERHSRLRLALERRVRRARDAATEAYASEPDSSEAEAKALRAL